MRPARYATAAANASHPPARSWKNVENAISTCGLLRRSPRSVSGPSSSSVGGGWIAHSGAPSSPISFENASWCRSTSVRTPWRSHAAATARMRSTYAPSNWPWLGSSALQFTGSRR